MKKVGFAIFSYLLVLTLLLAPTGIVRAEDLNEPIVTPVSGDMEFTTTFIPIAEFPGTAEYDQMIVPVGYPDGEAQFQGDGVIVTGMDSGVATACFTITGTQWGWGGKVALWNGSKWVKLETSITTPDESPSSIACAPITGNGTYVFIRYVVNVDLLPKYIPPCSEKTLALPVVMPAMYNRFRRTWIDGYLWLGMGGNTLYSDKLYAVGTPVAFELLESNPTDIFSMPLKTSGVISYVYGPITYGPMAGSYMYMINFGTQKFTYLGHDYPSLQYQVSLPECNIYGTYPPEMAVTN
jgi:hypothetical protein